MEGSAVWVTPAHGLVARQTACPRQTNIVKGFSCLKLDMSYRCLCQTGCLVRSSDSTIKHQPGTGARACSRRLLPSRNPAASKLVCMFATAPSAVSTLPRTVTAMPGPSRAGGG